MVVVGVLLWLFLAPPRPTWWRHKRLDRIRASMASLAMSRTGSSLVVSHEGTGRSFSLLKERDSGELQQTILFVLAEREWSPQVFEVARGVLEQASFVERCEITGDRPDRSLVCSMTGTPASMTFFADHLMAVIAPVLGFDQGDRFTLRVDGAVDNAIWRRLNVQGFQDMASDEDQPWIMRRFARWQLRKHNDERRD